MKTWRFVTRARVGYVIVLVVVGLWVWYGVFPTNANHVLVINDSGDASLSEDNVTLKFMGASGQWSIALRGVSEGFLWVGNVPHKFEEGNWLISQTGARIVSLNAAPPGRYGHTLVLRYLGVGKWLIGWDVIP
jgi:hypothetical protein